MTITPTIAFIGNGNMAQALVAGLIKHGYPAMKIWVAGPNPDKLTPFVEQFGVKVTTHNQEAANQADILIFAVKPLQLPHAAAELGPIVAKRKVLVISIAAGISLRALRSWLGHEPLLIRCMPNMPALVQQGITALYADPQISAADRRLAEGILQAVGQTLWLENEEDLDKVTAISGSGPAFFYYILSCLTQSTRAYHDVLIELLQFDTDSPFQKPETMIMRIVEKSMESAALTLGLAEATARLLVQETAYGSFYLANESQQSITTLIERVTSKGGTTEAGLNVLKGSHLEAMLQGGGVLDVKYLTGLLTQTLQAAWERSRELGQTHT